MIQSQDKPPIAPFIFSIAAIVLATPLAIALIFGLKIQLSTATVLIVPGMFFSALCVAISIGWIFVSLSRFKRRPRSMRLTAIFLALAMIELLALTLLMLRNSTPIG